MTVPREKVGEAAKNGITKLQKGRVRRGACLDTCLGAYNASKNLSVSGRHLPIRSRIRLTARVHRVRNKSRGGGRGTAG